MRVLLALLLLLPAPLCAGGWLREDGSVFLSFGENIVLTEGAALPVHHDPSLYVEWGATQDLTLSFNVFSGDAGRETTVEAFGIVALPLAARFGSATLSFGLGHRAIADDGADTLAGVGLSWGMGWDQGWLALDVRAMADVDTGSTEGKLDLTIGHHFSNRWSGMLQLQTGVGRTGDAYAKLVPMAVFRVNESTRLSAGLTQALSGDNGTGLYLGTWVEF